MIKGTYRRKSIWAYSSKGVKSTMVEPRHSGKRRELKAHILNHKHKAERKLDTVPGLKSESLLPVAYFLQ